MNRFTANIFGALPTSLQPRHCLAALLFAVLAPAAPADTRNTEAELDALKSRIESVKSSMSSAREKAAALDAELRRAEVRIGENAVRIRELENDIESGTRRLATLREERGEHQARLDEERALLSDQIRAAYKMGRQDYFKLLLNQQDPYAISRCLTYYDYFNRARTSRIEKVTYRLNRVTTLERAIGDETARLQALRDTRLREQADYDKRREGRKLVLTQLQQSISERGRELERLQENQRELGELLARLREQSVPRAAERRRKEPFQALKGKLPWPAPGPLASRFGTPRRSGAMQWSGVMIAADSGRDVRAISHGRVVYADWLRHFGLLLILDHGDGYMSLYGHNQALYREVGDEVEPGEIVASVGDTGGLADAALYFEIRHQGRPQDPVYWCRAENR